MNDFYPTYTGPTGYQPRDDDIIGRFAGSPMGFPSCKTDEVDLSIDSLHGFMPEPPVSQPKMSLEQKMVDQYLVDNPNWMSNSNEYTGNDLLDFTSMFFEEKQKKGQPPQKHNLHDYMANTVDSPVSNPPVSPVSSCSGYGKQASYGKMKNQRLQGERSQPYGVGRHNHDHNRDPFNPVAEVEQYQQHIEYVEEPVIEKGNTDFMNSLHDDHQSVLISPTQPSAPIEPAEYDSGEPEVEVLIQDPITKVQYTIGMHKLSRALEEYGTRVDRPRQNTKTHKQIEDMVKKFCNARDLSFMKPEDAKEIVEYGREIVNIPLKGKREDGQFKCLICPLTQSHGRGFDRKEDLKRHNQLHFKYDRFRCKHCQYGNSRTDHMKLHIKKCHPEKDDKDYIRT